MPTPPAVDPNAVKHVEAQAAQLKSRFEIKAKTQAGVNFAAAFLLFCKGISLQEIADEFGMSYARLLAKCREEDWERLAIKQGIIVAPAPRAEVTQVSAELVEKKQAAIIANREAALAVGINLRANIVKVLRAYEQDNAFLRPDDILTLAKAAKLVDESSMIALGDDYVTKTPAHGMPGGGNGQPAIVINLPAAVSRRRETAAEPADAEDSEPVPELEAVHEIAIVGKRAGEREAVAAKTNVGHTVNFDALQKSSDPVTPAKP